MTLQSRPWVSFSWLPLLLFALMYCESDSKHPDTDTGYQPNHPEMSPPPHPHFPRSDTTPEANHPDALPLLGNNSYTVVTTVAGDVVCLDTKTGHQLWEASLGGALVRYRTRGAHVLPPFIPALSNDNTLYHCTTDGRLRKASLKLSDLLLYSGGLQFDGHVLYGSKNNRYFELSLETGVVTYDSSTPSFDGEFEEKENNNDDTVVRIVRYDVVVDAKNTSAPRESWQYSVGGLSFQVPPSMNPRAVSWSMVSVFYHNLVSGRTPEGSVWRHELKEAPIRAFVVDKTGLQEIPVTHAPVDIPVNAAITDQHPTHTSRNTEDTTETIASLDDVFDNADDPIQEVSAVFIGRFNGLYYAHTSSELDSVPEELTVRVPILRDSFASQHTPTTDNHSPTGRTAGKFLPAPLDASLQPTAAGFCPKDINALPAFNLNPPPFANALVVVNGQKSPLQGRPTSIPQYFMYFGTKKVRNNQTTHTLKNMALRVIQQERLLKQKSSHVAFVSDLKDVHMENEKTAIPMSTSSPPTKNPNVRCPNSPTATSTGPPSLGELVMLVLQYISGAVAVLLIVPLSFIVLRWNDCLTWGRTLAGRGWRDAVYRMIAAEWTLTATSSSSSSRPRSTSDCSMSDCSTSDCSSGTKPQLQTQPLTPKQLASTENSSSTGGAFPFKVERLTQQSESDEEEGSEDEEEETEKTSKNAFMTVGDDGRFWQGSASYDFEDSDPSLDSNDSNPPGAAPLFDFEIPQSKPTNKSSIYEELFEVKSKLGAGGFGDVYLVKQKTDQRSYALKRILFGEKITKAQKDKATREAVLLAQMEHPNIVRYYFSWEEDYNEAFDRFQVEDASISFFSESSMESAGKPDSQLLILMEYLPTTLSDYFLNSQESKVETLSNLQRVRGLVKGLKYLHTKGILHRDLKPGNIFVTKNGDNKDVLKIGDFGLSRQNGCEIPLSPNTKGGTPNDAIYGSTDRLPVHYQWPNSDLSTGIGSPLYSAPEQLHLDKTGPGMPAYGESADIYSLGVIFFECYLRTKTDCERVHCLRKLRESGSIPPELNKHWPKEMELVQEMVAKDPSHRPNLADIERRVLDMYKARYMEERQTRERLRHSHQTTCEGETQHDSAKRTPARTTKTNKQNSARLNPATSSSSLPSPLDITGAEQPLLPATTPPSPPAITTTAASEHNPTPHTATNNTHSDNSTNALSPQPPFERSISMGSMLSDSIGELSHTHSSHSQTPHMYTATQQQLEGSMVSCNPPGHSPSPENSNMPKDCSFSNDESSSSPPSTPKEVSSSSNKHDSKYEGVVLRPSASECNLSHASSYDSILMDDHSLNEPDSSGVESAPHNHINDKLNASLLSSDNSQPPSPHHTSDLGAFDRSSSLPTCVNSVPLSISTNGAPPQHRARGKTAPGFGGLSLTTTANSKCEDMPFNVNDHTHSEEETSITTPTTGTTVDYTCLTPLTRDQTDGPDWPQQQQPPQFFTPSSRPSPPSNSDRFNGPPLREPWLTLQEPMPYQPLTPPVHSRYRIESDKPPPLRLPVSNTSFCTNITNNTEPQYFARTFIPSNSCALYLTRNNSDPCLWQLGKLGR